MFVIGDVFLIKLVLSCEEFTINLGNKSWSRQQRHLSWNSFTIFLKLTEMLSLVGEIVGVSEHVKSIFKGFDLSSLVFPWIFLNDKGYRQLMATDNLKSTKQKKDKSGLLRKTPFYLKTFLYLRQSCHRTWPGND